MTEPETYEVHNKKRASFTKKVLDSSADKMIVMAGPGTGKSFLFQQIAKDKIQNGQRRILVLTFINELVKDLTIDMHGLAEVSTLHSFAAKELRLSQSIYMGLLDVVGDDLQIEKSIRCELGAVLHNLEYGETEAIEYLRARRDYYASIDPASMVFELVNLYASDAQQIPKYDLILVDEYQDFNLLEVELISHLSSKSRVLIAGDDDQSLYSFKHSVPESIRKKYKSGEYSAFELPYCSRSTKVVIDAFHDIVEKAKSEGYITKRIEKQYLYFPCEKKDKVSAQHPKIIVRRNTQQIQNAFFIDLEIVKIFEIDPVFEVLIICPLRKQVKTLGAALRKKGYGNVLGDDLPNEESINLADGLGYIVENKDSNLGWRLCSEALMDAEEFAAALLKTAKCDIAFSECVPTGIKSQIKVLRAVCVKLKEGKTLDARQQKLLFEKLGISVEKLGEQDARNRIFSGRSNKPHLSTKIKLTSILGSKGLSYDYVFMVNFDDKYLIPKKVIDDESINKFLVAMTRSRKKIFIFSSQAKEAIFVSWIMGARKKLLGD